MEYHDRVLKCAECGAEFVFTAGEQMFFADKGFKNEPKIAGKPRSNSIFLSDSSEGALEIPWAMLPACKTNPFPAAASCAAACEITPVLLGVSRLASCNSCAS